MTTLRDKVAGERRRLKSVRETMTAAVARKSGGDAAFVPFYVAVADYIETSMGRLHAQDVKMGDMIRTKLGKLDAQAEQALAELDERLAGNQEHLKAFSAAKRALEGGGAAALAQFEAVAALLRQEQISGRRKRLEDDGEASSGLAVRRSIRRSMPCHAGS